MENILNEIKQERFEQDVKWGEQNHKPIEWIAILAEEVGEASKEALEHHFKHDLPKNTSNDAKLQVQRLKLYRKELIQVAAVAVQMVECLDRNQIH